MLSRSTQLALATRACLPAARSLAGVAGAHQEGLGERVKHAAEDVVHKVTDFVHERQERAKEEAERGMFTADDIQEAAQQMRQAQEHGKKKKPPRQYRPDEEEALLEDSSSDYGQPYRQKEMEEMRKAFNEDDTTATEAVRHAGQDYKQHHPTPGAGSSS